ncbi:hypothetical protein [Dictyobacter formicarum]|nr:hypothetical protein [Dictyobacter formicarum]
MTKRLTTQEDGVISFNAFTSYATALRTVTNLGLQLALFCSGPTMPWQPIGAKDDFKVTHGVSTSGKIGETPTVTYETNLPTMVVMTTPLTPADWQNRLRASSGVAKIEHLHAINCPAIPSKLPSGLVGSLPQRQVGTYVHIHFAPGVNYDDALYTIQNNGFRLANYCYEHEPGQPADWSPMSQDQPFARTHTLVVATTILSPTDWAKRIARTKGITSLQYPFSSTCS